MTKKNQKQNKTQTMHLYDISEEKLRQIKECFHNKTSSSHCTFNPVPFFPRVHEWSLTPWPRISSKLILCTIEDRTWNKKPDHRSVLMERYYFTGESGTFEKSFSIWATIEKKKICIFDFCQQNNATVQHHFPAHEAGVHIVVQTKPVWTELS